MRRRNLQSGAQKGLTMYLNKGWHPAAAVTAVFTVLLLAGCVSRPEPADQNYASLLYNERGIFLQVRPNQNFTLAETMLSSVGMNPESLRTVLERTHTAYCFFDFGTSGFIYTIIGEGRYPETIAALSLRSNREWERRESEPESRKDVPLRWWSNPNSGVALSFVEDNAVCITNGDIEAQLARIYYGPVIPLPQKASVMLNSGVMGLYSRNPDFSGVLGQSGRSAASGAVSRLFTRLDAISMSFHRSDENPDIFTIDAEYECANESVARSLFLMLRLALLSGLRSLAGDYDYSQLISDDPVSLEQTRVLLQAYPVSLENIDWFFQQALPYVRIEE